MFIEPDNKYIVPNYQFIMVNLKIILHFSKVIGICYNLQVISKNN